ncbi:glycosyltransferase [Nocardioides sp. R-C-SC26]|uniref:glycosyltransferase n=1 Tax=Nocardioides sp. R-C-SC26 TaxID=2870414 RepID=UPI001E3CA896|nr:glycosyltransferase [Nocardioides sp. R-C-SC26]
MLDEETAIALVRDSRLLDVEHYGTQVGVRFADRGEAARHWVRERPPHASPHPLFEPAWLYPGGRWQRDAPDPLSFYLHRPGGRGRSPHPRYPQAELGPLLEWLVDHDPAEVLPDAEPRAPFTDVAVRVPADDLHLAIRWIRHLGHRHPDATVLLEPTAPDVDRILHALAADRPQVRVGATSLDDGDAAGAPAVVVTVDPETPAPGWPWLDALVAALGPGVRAAQPLLLRDDFTVAAPLLPGHPVQDAERLDGLALPQPYPGVTAVRRGGSPDGATLLATDARLFGDDHAIAPQDADRWAHLWAPAGFEGAGRPLTVREGRPALRWSIDIPAGAAPIGRRWGDWHFARSLADALERRGQWVAIDHPETRERATRELDDVALTLRGLHRVAPTPGSVSLLWVIYDPDEVDAGEAAAYDAVFAASTTWAHERTAEWGVPISPLLQCTDTTRFHPDVAPIPDDGSAGPLFVANARGGMRPAVEAAIATGLDLDVVGAGWEAWLPDAEHARSGPRVVGTALPNQDLPAHYAGAAVVLNDHHEQMRLRGFVSNRVFDVLAVGGRLLTDDVAGLHEIPGLEEATVPIWRTPSDLARLARAPEQHWPDVAARRALAERVTAQHSFDARADALLEAAITLRAAADRG